MSEPDYQYSQTSVLISEEYQTYEETISALREDLSDQASEEEVSLEELRANDNWIDIPQLYEEGELGPVLRYRIDDEIEQRAVYIFDHHNGKEIIGDASMVACAGDLGLAPLMEDSLE